mmetsp:Transcript_41434/g.105565  ORF Transcript_41434/g.105565 Transcript_41434/m.105565 type:complete len:82 (-) Transcript_41434:134-379(-)
MLANVSRALEERPKEAEMAVLGGEAEGVAGLGGEVYLLHDDAAPVDLTSHVAVVRQLQQQQGAAEAQGEGGEIHGVDEAVL